MLCNTPPLKLLNDLNNDLLGIEKFFKGRDNEVFRAVWTRVPTMAKLLQYLFFNKGHIIDMALQNEIDLGALGVFMESANTRIGTLGGATDFVNGAVE